MACQVHEHDQLGFGVGVFGVMVVLVLLDVEVLDEQLEHLENPPDLGSCIRFWAANIGWLVRLLQQLLLLIPKRDIGEKNKSGSV